LASRPRLPLLWLAITLGTVLAGVAFVYWWERQLPARLAEAASRGQLEACLRYSDQLNALSWLPARSPLEQGRCRRDKAAQLWRQGQWGQALALQRQLLNSPAGGRADQQRFHDWQADLHRTAVERFRAGDLKGAMAALEPLGERHRSDGNALGDQLMLNWNRNRLEWERASTLVAKARWWEALDSLHRIDHPWWQRRAQPLSARVNEALEKLKGEEREHDGHGEVPHTVPLAQLDAEVSRRIAGGMNEWKAFEAGCQALGGKVVEAGPDTVCQR
jgi:hypothetical protein